MKIVFTLKKLDASDFEIFSRENIDELKYPQEYKGDSTAVILDDLCEKEKKDERVQALLKRSRYINISVYIITQDYYE